jgi:hypothetical protein
METTTRNYWPLGIIITFGLFFAGMAAVVGIASTHREDLVNGNYYEQELKYQDTIDSAARATAAGASIRYDAAAGLVTVIAPVAQLAQKFSGSVTLYRANDPKLDREFLLEPKSDGTQTLDVSKLAAGPWRVRAAWTADGKNYFLEEKFIVPAK